MAIFTGPLSLPDGTQVQVLVTEWADGTAEAATRLHDHETWGLPTALTRRKVE